MIHEWQFFFLKSIGYKSSEKIRFSEIFLNETYIRIKISVTKLIESNSILNIVMDESDNQTKKRILNICVLIQNKQSFHVIFESVESMKLNVRNETNWIFCQLNDLTNDFSKVCFFQTISCIVQRTI